ncbi:response regulator [Thermodesulfobacteriota bacterium]
MNKDQSIDVHDMSVLIVDDSINMCHSIQSMMKVIDYSKNFFFANNGKEALEVLNSEPVDLLMIDYNMPLMTGGEVVSRLREDRKLRDLPVIMITGEAYSDYVTEMGESEVDAYILKPLTIKVLKDKVSQVVDKANNPSPMTYHLKEARKYEEEGDLDAAIGEAELAKEANPKATKPIRELGYYYYKKNELDEAEKWFLEAAELNYLDVFALHHLGELYLQRNNIDSAIHYFEKAMKISPRQLNRGINLGKILIQKKLVGKAIKTFNMVFELPRCTSELKEEIVDFCIENGIDEYAVKILQILVDDQPKRGDLLFKLGKIHEKLGETIKAVTLISEAAEISTRNIDIRIHLGKIYLDMGKPILAEKPLVEVLEISEDHQEARELLKQCH